MGPQMEGVITKRMIGHKRTEERRAGGMWLRVRHGQGGNLCLGSSEERNYRDHEETEWFLGSKGNIRKD